MARFKDILKGGDLRSIGKANLAATRVNSQESFDGLFLELYDADRIVVMRAADAIEKVTATQPAYLQPHKSEVLSLCSKARDIELKWHLALLASRLKLTKKQTDNIWKTLSRWTIDKNESKIVRVNSLQALYNISRIHEDRITDFNLLLNTIENESIPSINARIRKLRKKQDC